MRHKHYCWATKHNASNPRWSAIHSSDLVVTRSVSIVSTPFWIELPRRRCPQECEREWWPHNQSVHDCSHCMHTLTHAATLLHCAYCAVPRVSSRKTQPSVDHHCPPAIYNNKLSTTSNTQFAVNVQLHNFCGCSGESKNMWVERDCIAKRLVGCTGALLIWFRKRRFKIFCIIV